MCQWQLEEDHLTIKDFMTALNNALLMSSVGRVDCNSSIQSCSLKAFRPK